MKPIDYDSAGQWPKSLRDAAFSRAFLAAACVCSLLVIAGAGATGHFQSVSAVVVVLVSFAALGVSYALLVLSLLGEPHQRRAVALRVWTLCLPCCASSSLLIVATVAPITRAFVRFVLTQPESLMLLVALVFAAVLISTAGPLLIWLIVHGWLLRRMGADIGPSFHQRSAVIAAITMQLATVFLALYQLTVFLRFPLNPVLPASS